MTENTSIIPAETLALSNQKFGKDVFQQVSKSSSYLERIQLLSGSSGIVKKGQFPMNHYGLAKGKDKFEDLGDEFDALIVSWRPKAMEIGSKQIVTVHDQSDDEFVRIMEQSDVKDSGCMFGPEYLLYLPKQEKFATFFCSSKTLRRASEDIHSRIGKWATFSVDVIDNGKYVWPGPIIEDCATQHAPPDMAAVTEEAEKFVNPPKSEVEKAEEVAGGRER